MQLEDMRYAYCHNIVNFYLCVVYGAVSASAYRKENAYNNAAGWYYDALAIKIF